MGRRRSPTIVMEWQSTLGAMRRHGTLVRAICRAPDCKRAWEVDVAAMIIELGSQDATLWDRHPPCPCDRMSEVLFLAAPGPGTPFRPLASDHLIIDAELPIQSMMDHWTGLKGR